MASVRVGGAASGGGRVPSGRGRSTCARALLRRLGPYTAAGRRRPDHTRPSLQDHRGKLLGGPYIYNNSAQYYYSSLLKLLFKIYTHTTLLIVLYSYVLGFPHVDRARVVGLRSQVW